MKPSRGWMLAWIAVVCLLWNLVLQASMNPASSFEKHSVWPKESRSPSSCQSMRVLRGGWIHSRAGPQEFLFTPDVSLRAEDLDPAGPPWLESRGPPGIYRDLGRPIGLAVAKVATAAFIERSNYASAPNFPAVGRPNLKHGVLQHALASAELYNSSTGTWTATGSMTTGRYSFVLTALPNGEVLAAGGTNCGGGGLTSAELYNPSTGTWTATGSMTVGNETNWAVLLQNGEVFVLNDNLSGIIRQQGRGRLPAKILSVRTRLSYWSRTARFIPGGPYRATAFTIRRPISGPTSRLPLAQCSTKVARQPARYSPPAKSWSEGAPPT